MSASRTGANSADRSRHAVPARSMRLALIVPPVAKVARKRRVVLEEGKTIDIGGTPDCHVLLDDPSVGAARVRIEQRGGEWTVQDLEGLGTCVVGGVRLRTRVPRILRPTVSLRIGNIECTVGLDVAPDADLSTCQIALQVVRDVGAVATDVPAIRIAEGDKMGNTLDLLRDQTHVVGRGANVDFFLEDPDVSRTHFSVMWQGARVLVTDLGAAGGTYLGGTRLERYRGAVWSPSTMLVAGRTVLLLEPTSRELLSEGAWSMPDSEPSVSSAAEESDTLSADEEASASSPEASETSSANAAMHPVGRDEAAEGRSSIQRHDETGSAIDSRLFAIHERAKEFDPHPRMFKLAVAAVVVLAVVMLSTLGWMLVTAS